jgi:hypothetical protein
MLQQIQVESVMNSLAVKEAIATRFQARCFLQLRYVDTRHRYSPSLMAKELVTSDAARKPGTEAIHQHVRHVHASTFHTSLHMCVPVTAAPFRQSLLGRRQRSLHFLVLLQGRIGSLLPLPLG